MGYTHYFESRRFSDQEWTRVTTLAKQIIANARRNRIKVAGWNGKGSPVLDDSEISLNGRVPDDCETFRIEKAGTPRNFCKTNRLPYDEVVVAILMAAQSTGALSWRSDGEGEELKDGQRCYENAVARVLGKAETPDINVTNHGTIYLMHAKTPAAHRWLREHTAAESQWLGDSLVVEHRFIADIVEGAREDGLRVA
jgi:hypothetical protein